MPYENFDDVVARGTTTQRELLQQGTPTERIWAAWALGLQLGRTVAPDLLHGLRSSPAPGTRRHLIVVLAGLGERAALVALAEHDPDEYVRATACQYLGRVVLPDDTEAAAFLRARLASDRSLEVQQAILRLALDRVLSLSMAAMSHHLQHSVRAIRQLAIEVLRATYPTAQLYPGPLETHLPVEPDADLRADLIVESIAAGGAERLLQLAFRADDDLRLEILRALARTEQRFTWEQIAPLARLQQPTIDVVLVALLRSDAAGNAFAWLLYCAARSVNWPVPQSREEWRLHDAVWQCAAKAQGLLFLALPTTPPLSLSPVQREQVTAIIIDLEYWERMAERTEEDWDDENGPWYSNEVIQEQLQLLNGLRTLRTSFSQRS